MRSYNPARRSSLQVIAAMSEALDDACAELSDTNRAELVREAFARRIIAAARLGERDPVRLREAALTEPRGERSLPRLPASCRCASSDRAAGRARHHDAA
jgi:hypothetical protein